MRHQAANVIQAAKDEGVKRIYYTSFCGAGLGETAKTEVEVLLMSGLGSSYHPS